MFKMPVLKVAYALAYLRVFRPKFGFKSHEGYLYALVQKNALNRLILINTLIVPGMQQGELFEVKST